MVGSDLARGMQYRLNISAGYGLKISQLISPSQRILLGKCFPGYATSPALALESPRPRPGYPKHVTKDLPSFSYS